MPKLIHRVTAVVRQSQPIADRIQRIELADPEGWELPPFSAGSHIDIHLPSGAVRQYSLCSDPADRHLYSIAVLKDEEGRGGAREIHELRPGTVLPISLPRNHFPLADGPHHVFLAGGIGITPFMPMMAELDRAGGSFELHYLARTPEGAAFAAELAERQASGRVHTYFTRTAHPRHIDLEALVASIAPDNHLYCCGPAAMLDAVIGRAAPVLKERLHHEAFGSGSANKQPSYQVKLARSGRLVGVPEGQTMLNALRNEGIDIEASCEGGVCLECKTRYLEGTPLHRDLVMKPEDRAQFLTPCVSGCAGSVIVLDL